MDSREIPLVNQQLGGTRLFNFYFHLKPSLAHSAAGPRTYAGRKRFLLPRLLFRQAPAFCFTQASPKCFQMLCFILPLIGEAARLGICLESVFS